MIGIDPLLVREVVESGKRVDGRDHFQYRNISVETNVVGSADGSARVQIGDTVVLAGVKVEVGTPFGDTPDEGVLMVGAEFVPLANSKFENGPPREDAIEVSRVVDRAIRESKSIDVNKLCIKAGEKVWMVFVDVDVLDDHGNLIDATSLAALAALMTTTVPKLTEEIKIDKENKGTEKLPIQGMPLCTTFVKIGDKIIVDPTSSEIEAMDARLTVGTFEKDGHVKLCSMQKGGVIGITTEELDKMVHLAEEKGKELRKFIKA